MAPTLVFVNSTLAEQPQVASTSTYITTQNKKSISRRVGATHLRKASGDRRSRSLPNVCRCATKSPYSHGHLTSPRMLPRTHLLGCVSFLTERCTTCICTTPLDDILFYYFAILVPLILAFILILNSSCNDTFLSFQKLEVIVNQDVANTPLLLFLLIAALFNRKPTQ